MFTWDWLLFAEVILSLLSLTFIILGLLTAYFGSGKSRIAGISLFVIGIVIPIFLYIFDWIHKPGYFMDYILMPSLLYIGGALIGVIIGFLAFLGIIMKT